METNTFQKKKWPTRMLVVSFAGTFIIGAMFLIFSVGVIYFQYFHPFEQSAEGDWSALNHIFFLIFTSPFLIGTAFALSSWLIHGLQRKLLKLATTVLLFLSYGGLYFFILWHNYPPNP
ncbi:hypothetical protein ACEU07_15205 [Chromobacterium violaceum]|uniref:Uncharacterized protein n=1 Tax=Chromobacterium violaceum (strain ATCC 12472 / DSM 30191 / JCM 1249 / CCUG 213 / NBRC 12614 / NCIMB 9131 / NCTC 9757 / MK) TaxID=243365 RepID=Q7NQZ7_CHRVO|nr:hypothetical protein CV_3988 [Chromobacterium violaceum ATCC 12472]